MDSPIRDFDPLLSSTNPVEASLAQELLAEAGIPCLLHPLDSREAFVLCWNPLDAPALYVPRGQRWAAAKVLREAWGDEVFERAASPGRVHGRPT